MPFVLPVIRTAGELVFTPVGTIAATDVQAAIAELDGDVSGLETNKVPYTGASGAVNLGVHNLTTTGTITGNRLLVADGTSGSPAINFSGNEGIYSDGSGVNFVVNAGDSMKVRSTSVSFVGNDASFVREANNILSFNMWETGVGSHKYMETNVSTEIIDFQEFDLTTTGTGAFSKALTPEIKTDTSAPTDLTVTTGAAKTLVLATVVYDDVQFPVATGKVTPASGEPTWETFTTNTKEYAFGIDDYIDLQANELPHWWKEGTAGNVHVHFTIKTAQNTGFNRFAKFSVWVAYADSNEVWVEQAVLTAEDTIPTGSGALTNFYLAMGDATLTNYLVGAQVKIRVKRIDATGGTEYADDVYITQVGMHLQKTRLGSRAETTS